MLNDQETNDNIITYGNLFSVGEEVKVIDGAFSTFKGNVSSVDNDKKKIKHQILNIRKMLNVVLIHNQIKMVLLLKVLNDQWKHHS